MEHDNTSTDTDAPTPTAGALALVANTPRVIIRLSDDDTVLGAALSQLGSPSVDAKHDTANSNVLACVIAAKYTALANSGILEGLESKIYRRTVQAVLALGKHANKEDAKRAQSCVSMASKRLRESSAGEQYAWPPKTEKTSVDTAIQTLKDWLAQASEDHCQALVAWVPIAVGDARRTNNDHAAVLAARAALTEEQRTLLGL